MFNLADFPELARQLAQGQISEIEFLLRVQMNPEQTGWLLAANKLPYKDKEYNALMSGHNLRSQTQKQCVDMNFGQALDRIKSGTRVGRSGWEGKNMWLVLVKASSYYVGIRSCANAELLPWIGMRTADNKFVHWLASQDDIMAEDWLVVSATD